jgi:hypothetical protein
MGHQRRLEAPDRPSAVGVRVATSRISSDDAVDKIARRRQSRRAFWRNLLPMNIANFNRRLHDEWLPDYCRDPKREYSVEGYKPASNLVTEEHARDFISAMDTSGFNTDSGAGRFRTPRSKANEVLFWEGLKLVSPRPITLWMEPVITFAAVGRLHLDHGWPIETIGMQSRDWAFDFTTFLPHDHEHEYIADELKKTVREMERLIEDMQACCVADRAEPMPTNREQRNAFRKWQGLKHSQARLFWLVGPGTVNHVFRVAHADTGAVNLQEVGVSQLAYPG